MERIKAKQFCDKCGTHAYHIPGCSKEESPCAFHTYIVDCTCPAHEDDH